MADKLVKISRPSKSLELSWTHPQWHWEIGIFRINLAGKIFFLKKAFQARQTFHFEMLVWNKLVDSFLVCARTIFPVLLFYQQNIVQEMIWELMFHFFMACLSSISITSSFAKNSCVLDVVTYFGMFFALEFLRMVSRTPLPQINFFDLGSSFPSSCWDELIFLLIAGLEFFTKWWIFVRDSSGINSGNFLDKWSSFWYKTLLVWDTTALFAVLFSTILRVMSVSIVHFLP